MGTSWISRKGRILEKGEGYDFPYQLCVFNTLAYSNKIMHIQELSRDIQAHSEASVTLVYSETWHIQNQSHIQSTGTSRTSSIFTTLSSICNGAYYENNANSFLHYFQMWQTVTLVRLVIVELVFNTMWPLS